MSQRTKNMASIPAILGVEVGCRRHFSYSEWRTICPGKATGRLELRPGFLRVSSIPLEALESITFLENAKMTELYYVHRMAYWQRINLPLEYLKSKKKRPLLRHQFRKYMNNTPNFLELLELFNSHYEEIATLAKKKLDMQSYKPILEQNIFNCALEFWLTGHAIRPGLGTSYITDEFLEEFSDGYKKIGSVRLFGQLLIKSPKSMVNNISGGYVQINIFETEQALWDRQVFIETKNSVLINYLYQYAFVELKSRINQKTIADYADKTGFLELRACVNAISYTTWKLYASDARRFAVLCITSKQLTITEAFGFDAESSASTFLSDPKGRGKRRIVLRNFASWINRSQNEKIDLEQLFPRTFSKSKNTWAKVWNLGKTAHFIQILVDDNSEYFNEKNILEFRCRRAALLCLALGSRPHEALVLFKDCLKPDHFGIEYVLFHKTKPVRNNPKASRVHYLHNLPIKKDVKKWIAELQAVAPKKKLLFKSEMGFGDDLEAHRLFADSTDTGPLTVQMLDDWLGRLQKKIWPDEPKPYFTIGKFRSLSATYEMLKNDENGGEHATNKLGHGDLNTKKPYVMTLSGNDVGKLANISPWSSEEEGEGEGEEEDEFFYSPLDDDEEGVLFNLTSEESDDGIKVSSAVCTSSIFQVTPEKILQTRKLIDATIPIVEAMGITQTQDTSLCGGYTHNCSAPSILNCTQSPDRCRACEYYKPDEGTEEIHRAQIFSSMVHCLKCIEEESKYKASGFREKLVIKTADLKALINQSEQFIWVQGFKMEKSKAKRLHNNLWSYAKKYTKEFQKLFNSLPHTPSLKESIEYFNTGEIKLWEEHEHIVSQT